MPVRTESIDSSRTETGPHVHSAALRRDPRSRAASHHPSLSAWDPHNRRTGWVGCQPRPLRTGCLIGPHGTLRGHVARANPVWQQASSGTEVLVVFRGADGYVSPNWYPSKHESHRQVPTWNYEVVHAHGTLTIHDDEKYVRGVVARLTRTHECREPQPWKMKDAAPGYIDSMLQVIVGFEVQITRIVGKVKLSQNRELRDRSNAAEELRKRAHVALADAMDRTK